MQGRGCLFTAFDIEAQGGPKSLGYASWEALWQDYYIFAPIRNPFDRAGSAYEYLTSGPRVKGKV